MGFIYGLLIKPNVNTEVSIKALSSFTLVSGAKLLQIYYIL